MVIFHYRTPWVKYIHGGTVPKKRRGYFKHYNDASQGQSLQELFYKKEYRAVCLFWAIIERANQLAVDNSGDFSVDKSYFCRVLNIRASSLERDLNVIRLSFGRDFCETRGNTIRFLIPNYAEYQDLRVNNAGQIRPPLKIKDKRLNIYENNDYRDNANKLNNRYIDLCKTIKGLERGGTQADWDFYNQFKRITGIDKATVKTGNFDRTLMRDKIENHLKREVKNEF